MKIQFLEFCFIVVRKFSDILLLKFGILPHFKTSTTIVTNFNFLQILYEFECCIRFHINRTVNHHTTLHYNHFFNIYWHTFLILKNKSWFMASQISLSVHPLMNFRINAKIFMKHSIYVMAHEGVVTAFIIN